MRALDALLMFAPPQLSRKTPNASTEDLDKWNSAGTSKQRKLAKVASSVTVSHARKARVQPVGGSWVQFFLAEPELAVQN